jgi:hypothetical protein
LGDGCVEDVVFLKIVNDENPALLGRVGKEGDSGIASKMLKEEETGK